MIKAGRIYDVHDQLYQINDGPKDIIKTGPDFAVGVHSRRQIPYLSVNRSILCLAEYRKRWRNDPFVKDERMKRFTPYMMQIMRRIQGVYNDYFNISE